MGKINFYNELGNAQIEGLAATPSNLPDGRVFYNNVTNNLQIVSSGTPTMIRRECLGAIAVTTGTVYIKAGVYFLSSLSVSSGATLSIKGDGEPCYFYVEGNASIEGTIEYKNIDRRYTNGFMINLPDGTSEFVISEQKAGGAGGRSGSVGYGDAAGGAGLSNGFGGGGGGGGANISTTVVSGGIGGSGLDGSLGTAQAGATSGTVGIALPKLISEGSTSLTNGSSAARNVGGNGGSGASGGGSGGAIFDTVGAPNGAAGGGGGAGGKAGNHGGIIVLTVTGNITGSGSINVAGSNGVAGTNGGAAYYAGSGYGAGGGGGGGGGAGGAGGSAYLYYVGTCSLDSGDVSVTGGTGGAGGSYGSGAGTAATAGSTGTSGANGSVTIEEL